MEQTHSPAYTYAHLHKYKHIFNEKYYIQLELKRKETVPESNNVNSAKQNYDGVLYLLKDYDIILWEYTLYCNTTYGK